MEQVSDLKAYRSIDTMCRLYYFDSEFTRSFFDAWEQRQVGKASFAGVMKRLGLQEGEEWKILGLMGGKPSAEDMIKEMDDIGVNVVFVDQLCDWSLRDKKEIGHYPLEKLAELVRRFEGRMVGGAGYHPFKIGESLVQLDRAVKEFGFKYVWFDPITWGLRPDDKKLYPLYAKCQELGIPCCLQSGHCARPVPSEVGHPMYAGEVACDFPDLTLVLTHTGWPWCDEWISMIWRHPNVYGNIGAYMPSELETAVVKFMDGRGRDKIFWASNGWGLTRCKQEFLELPIREETKAKVLWDNAVKIFKIPV